MPRNVNASIIAELDNTAFEAPIYAVRITRESDTLYWAEREVTIDGQAYQARLLAVDGLEIIAGVASQFTITALNIDGAITTLDRAESFAGCRCEVLEYMSTLNLYSRRATGYLDEIAELDAETARIPITVEHTGSSLIGIPKRSVSPSCPHHFANISNYVNVRDFEGSECPYQRVSTIGFSATLLDNLDAVTDPVTFLVSWDGGIDGMGAKFKATDQITIDSERMLITAADDVDINGDQEITVTRGYNGTTMAVHSASPATFVKFANCQFSDSACIRRGMYGNNSFDTFSGTPRNYFGGFPIITGTQWGFFRTKQGEKPSPQRLNFSGNESAYGLALCLPYGKVRISDPILILAIGEGDFLTTFWAVSEGLLATNSTDDTQTTRINAYSGGGSQMFVNGVSRHDSRPGYGIEQWNGQMDQEPPSSVWFPGDYPEDFDSFFLGFNATAWVVMRINQKNNPGVDVTGQQITGAFTVEYGRVVRVYTSASPETYTRKATTDPAWVAFDIRTAKRVGAGVDYSRMNIQAYIDVAAYNAGTVTTTDEEAVGSVSRWTFNGVFDQKRPFAEWERMVCLGMHCIPPFIGSDGKYKIKSLKAETLSGLPFLSSLVASSARNILWEPGENGVERSSLVKIRKSLLEIPNQITATFIDKATFTKLTVTVADRDAQEELGRKLGDQSRRVIEKQYSLPGTSTLEEAARWATLLLRIGEFGQGGIANNNGVKFKMFYRGAVNLEIGDIVELQDDQLDAAEGEQYYRISRLGDEITSVNEGGFLYEREVEAWVHDNAMYDDGAFTVTHFERVTGAVPNDQEPPAVTGLFITEAGALDANDKPVSRLTITYTEPSPKENFRSVVMFMSSDDGGGSPAGDWRFLGELLESGGVIEVPVTGELTHFAAVSRALSGHVADVDTLDSGGSFKYPRDAIVVDGYTDTSTADAPELGVTRSQAQHGSSRYEMTVGIDVPTPAPSFWKTVYQTEVQITTDAGFSSFPTGKSLNQIYKWTPPNSVEFSTNFPGTYYMRARVYNRQGPGNWGSLSRSTDFLESLTNDTDIIEGVTPTLSVKSGATNNQLGGNEIDVTYEIPSTNSATFYGRSLYVHDSSTLPTATTQETGSAGFLSAGVAQLVDVTKSWTVNAWQNKDIVIFSEKRGATPTFDYEGQMYVCKILSNTADTIVFDAPAESVRRTVGSLKYYVVNRGANHHFWEKLKYATPCETDEGVLQPTIELSSRKRTRRISIGFAPAYVWVALYNAYGQGKVTATPPNATVVGMTSFELATDSVTTAKIAAGAVIASRMSVQAQGFNTDIVFSATDNDTVAWTSGSIRTADGTTYSISSGNTGNMSALTFIYLDKATSTTVLQTTTTYSTASGDDRILLCTAKNIADTNQKAFFVPAVGVFGINETNIGPRSISADLIKANTITANEIAANTITTGQLNAAAIDGMTITGAVVRNTSSSVNRIQFDSTSFTVTDSGGTEWFKIQPGTIGVKVYTSTLRMHPNVTGTFIIGGRTNAANDVSILTGDGSVLGSAAFVDLVHGSYVGFGVNNTQYGYVDTAGFHGAGSNLTSLNADNLSSGTLPSGRLSGTYSSSVAFSSVTALTMASANISFSSGFGIASGTTSFEVNSSYARAYHSGNVVLELNNTNAKIMIGGVLYTLSVDGSGFVKAA